MAQGKFRKWATAKVSEPIALGKSGIKVVIWDKWGRTRRGTAVVSVGGIRWKSYKKQSWRRLSWDQLDKII